MAPLSESIPTERDWRPPDRLQKVLAAAGVASRRKVEEMVLAGRVRVNGCPARLGQRLHPEHDRVEIDGVCIGLQGDLVYYLLNKAKGVVSTASDPQGRPTVLDGLPPAPRVYPVGRLDINSEGLLVLTNDGELTYRITHPSGGCEKEYLLRVKGTPSAAVLRKLRNGVELNDGVTAPARVSVHGPGVMSIVLSEGRNRQVRRMCEAVGHPVLRLVRTRVGPISVGKLRPGEWREMSQPELRSLERSLAGSASHLRSSP